MSTLPPIASARGSAIAPAQASVIAAAPPVPAQAGPTPKPPPPACPSAGRRARNAWDWLQLATCGLASMATCCCCCGGCLGRAPPPVLLRGAKMGELSADERRVAHGAAWVALGCAATKVLPTGCCCCLGCCGTCGPDELAECTGTAVAGPVRPPKHTSARPSPPLRP